MLEPFRRYLSENARIKVKYIPYYLKWISECYSYTNRSIEQHISSEQKQQFLSHMSKSHEDWQVKQADYALRLYNFFLFHHREEFSSDSANFKNEWKMIEDNTRNALRLRHPSLSTGKSYISYGFVSFGVSQKQKALYYLKLIEFAKFLLSANFKGAPSF